MTWPSTSPPALLAYAPRNDDYPSVGGNILKGASPEALRAARDVVDRSSAIPGPPAPPP